MKVRKYDLIVFIKSSGPNIRKENLAETLKTFSETNKNLNYGLYLSVDEPLEKIVRKIIKYLNIEEKVLELNVCRQHWQMGHDGCAAPEEEYNESWARDYNTFFNKYKDFAEWILISHDDVAFITENYFQEILKRVDGHEEKIGWITSNSLFYINEGGSIKQDVLRPGFYTDFEDSATTGAEFHLHKYRALVEAAKEMGLKSPSSLLQGNKHLMDLPKKPVKVHGIQSAIMIISTKAMEKIGPCEEWTNYTMLIDEDWSLRALENNLWNVFIPDVFHKHPLRPQLRRTHHLQENNAHIAFKEKWGFYICEDYNTRTLYKQGLSIPVDELRKKYKGTNIPWSTYRKSYEWEYLDGEE
jgi:hypothetical protein